MQEQALAGVKVLDLTQHVAGPFCTRLLADYGAEVIKVERPGGGDVARSLGPFQGDDPHLEKSGLFFFLNTNKRSITLNLATATGQHILKRLAHEVDLVVESFQPGTMARFGLDYPALEKASPKLIMASITNFGQSGPYRDYKASELILDGMGSEMVSRGQPDREPLKYGGTVVLFQAGLLACGGILGALVAARLQGVGQHLDLSIMEMLNANYDSRAPGLVTFSFTGEAQGRTGGLASSWPPTGVFPCADGYMDYFSPGRWHLVVQWLGMPELLNDPRFATPQARAQPEHAEEMNAIILSWLLQRTRQQAWEESMAAGMLCAPCMTAQELLQDPHFRSRGYWTQVEHPVMGKLAMPGRPFAMSQTPWQLRRPAPLLGQHNREVYQGLGYSAEDLVRLREASVI